MPLARRVPEIRHDRSLRSSNRRSRDRRNHGGTVLQKANQTQPLKSQQLYFENEAFLIKRVFLAHFHGFVIWFVHVSNSCHPRIDRTLSVRRIVMSCIRPDESPKFESFSVHQIVNPGIVEITLFQRANQTQLLHNSTLKMKPFFSISYQNIFSAHFRGFVAFVVLWFGLSKFQSLTVHVLIVRCQDE